MKLFALHDVKAKALTHFSVQKSDVVASRGFAEAVLEKDSPLGKYPEDFELVSLCSVSQDYDDLPESMVSDFEFRVVITASQVLAAQPKADAQLSLIKEA